MDYGGGGGVDECGVCGGELRDEGEWGFMHLFYVRGMGIWERKIGKVHGWLMDGQIWHLLLTQGFLYGVGSSMMYFPILSVAPEYFDQHRGSAMGVILSGAGVGMRAFPYDFSLPNSDFLQAVSCSLLSFALF